MSRSTTQIEREVEAKRDEVEETLEAIRLKLSTAQLIEGAARALTGAGAHGGVFFSNLGRQVKENPLPIALTGIGLAWLLINQSRPTATQSPPGPPAAYDRDRFATDEAKHGATYAIGQLRAGTYDLRTAPDHAGTAYDRSRFAADEAKHGRIYAAQQLKSGAYRVGAADDEAMCSAYDAARFAADEARYGLRYAADQLKGGAYRVSVTQASGRRPSERARVATDGGRDGAEHVAAPLKAGASAVSDAASSAYTAARDAAGTARAYGQRTQRNVTGFIAEDPLLAGAIGVAIGATIGALLPSTPVEDQVVGPHRDRIHDDALDVAAEQAARADDGLAPAHHTARDDGLVRGES